MKCICLMVLSFVLAYSVALGAEDSTKSPPAAGSKAYKNIGVEEFDKLRSDKKNVVLDVRTPKEFATGHIPGSINIDWNAADFEKQVSELDKGKTYLVHCAVGGRSAKASDKLTNLHFKSVYNLQGGMTAWTKAGKPMEK